MALFLNLTILSSKPRPSKNTMARRYRSKLHILQNDDLASILMPAEPCLSRKGRDRKSVV